MLEAIGVHVGVGAGGSGVWVGNGVIVAVGGARMAVGGKEVWVGGGAVSVGGGCVWVGAAAMGVAEGGTGVDVGSGAPQPVSRMDRTNTRAVAQARLEIVFSYRRMRGGLNQNNPVAPVGVQEESAVRLATSACPNCSLIPLALWGRPPAQSLPWPVDWTPG